MVAGVRRDPPGTRRPVDRGGYYRPLLNFFASVDAQNTRVEIVPDRPALGDGLRRHARSRSPGGGNASSTAASTRFFYDGDLTDAELHQWLRESGVGYVALADTTLDDSGVEEAALIEADPPYLDPVWHNEHWRVWKVVDSTGLIDGPARLIEFGVDTVSLEVLAPGDVLVRVRVVGVLELDPPVCIEPTDDGWIVLRDVRPGPARAPPRRDRPRRATIRAGHDGPPITRRRGSCGGPRTARR